MADFEITYNGITLREEDGYNVNFLDGLDIPVLRNSMQDRTAEDGTNLFARFYGGRQIAIRGTIVASSSADYFAKKQALAVAFDKTSSAVMSIKLWDGSIYYLTAETINAPNVSEVVGELTMGRFSIIVLGQDPYLNDGITKSLTLIQGASSGAVFPAVAPLALGSGTGTDTGIIINNGHVADYPVITFSGSITGATITNQTTGEALSFSTTIAAGASVVCYRYKGASFYELNGTAGEPGSGTDYVANKTGNLFKLALGSNSLKLTATSFGGGASCTINFLDKYLSV